MKRIAKSDCGLETSVNIVKMRLKNLFIELQAVEERNKWTAKNIQITSTGSCDILHPTIITHHGHLILKSSDQNTENIDIIHS